MQRENLLQLRSLTEHTSTHQQRNHLHQLSYNSLYSTLLRQRQPRNQRNKQKVQDWKGYVMKMKKRRMRQWMKMMRMTRWTYLTKIKRWTRSSQSPYLVLKTWGSTTSIAKEGGTNNWTNPPTKPSQRIKYSAGLTSFFPRDCNASAVLQGWMKYAGTPSTGWSCETNSQINPRRDTL